MRFRQHPAHGPAFELPGLHAARATRRHAAIDPHPGAKAPTRVGAHRDLLHQHPHRAAQQHPVGEFEPHEAPRQVAAAPQREDASAPNGVVRDHSEHRVGAPPRGPGPAVSRGCAGLPLTRPEEADPTLRPGGAGEAAGQAPAVHARVIELEGRASPAGRECAQRVDVHVRRAGDDRMGVPVRADHVRPADHRGDVPPVRLDEQAHDRPTAPDVALPVARPRHHRARDFGGRTDEDQGNDGACGQETLHATQRPRWASWAASVPATGTHP